MYLPPATKLGQGYIFTGVCDYVNGGVPGPVGCAWFRGGVCLVPGCVWSQGMCLVLGMCLVPGCVPGPRGVCLVPGGCAWSRGAAWFRGVCWGVVVPGGKPHEIQKNGAGVIFIIFVASKNLGNEFVMIAKTEHMVMINLNLRHQ